MISKKEETNIDLNKLNLKFGKCIFREQYEKVKSLLENLEIPFGHPPDCPFEQALLNKSDSEISEIEKTFDEMIAKKNKKIKFASVGILRDNQVGY